MRKRGSERKALNRFSQSSHLEKNFDTIGLLCKCNAHFQSIKTYLK